MCVLKTTRLTAGNNACRDLSFEQHPRPWKEAQEPTSGVSFFLFALRAQAVVAADHNNVYAFKVFKRIHKCICTRNGKTDPVLEDKSQQGRAGRPGSQAGGQVLRQPGGRLACRRQASKLAQNKNVDCS